MSGARLAGILILSVVLCMPSFAFNDSLLPQIIVGEPGKKVGDIILPATRAEMAAWCDFSKQVVPLTLNGIYMCSYNGNTIGQ